jgi:trimeric autotransporter adhesin
MSFNSHEFRVHASVVELLEKFNISTDDAESLVETLFLNHSQSQSQSQSQSHSPSLSQSQHSLSQYSQHSPSESAGGDSQQRGRSQIISSNSLKTSPFDIASMIASRTNNSETKKTIMDKFSQLKTQQIHELPAFLEFLERVQREPDVAKLLSSSSTSSVSGSAQSSHHHTSMNMNNHSHYQSQSNTAPSQRSVTTTTAAAAREALKSSRVGKRPQANSSTSTVASAQMSSKGLTSSSQNLIHRKSDALGINTTAVNNLKEASSSSSPSPSLIMGSVGVLGSRASSSMLASQNTPGGKSEREKARLFSKSRSLSTNNLADVARVISHDTAYLLSKKVELIFFI